MSRTFLLGMLRYVCYMCACACVRNGQAQVLHEQANAIGTDPCNYFYEVFSSVIVYRALQRKDFVNIQLRGDHVTHESSR